jgi:hypothetical protein
MYTEFRSVNMKEVGRYGYRWRDNIECNLHKRMSRRSLDYNELEWCLMAGFCDIGNKHSVCRKTEFLGHQSNCQLLEEKRIMELHQSVTGMCTACLEFNFWAETLKIITFKTIHANCFKISPLFWDVTQRWLVVSHGRFRTTCRSHFQGSSSSRSITQSISKSKLL